MIRKHAPLAILVAVLSFSAMASCNPGGNGPLDLSKVNWAKFREKTNNPTKVSFWGTFSPTQSNFVIIKDAFEKAYPGIQLDYTQYGGYDDLFNSLKKAVNGGNTPTMAYCYPDHVATYLSQNMAVEDMTPFMDNDKEGFGQNDIKIDINDNEIQLHTEKEDMIQGYLEEGHKYSLKGGALLDGYFSVPWSRSTEVMFYNATALERQDYEDGTRKMNEDDLATWDGVWKFAEKLKTDPVYQAIPGDEDGQGLVPLAYDSDDNLFITTSKQLGVPYTDGSQKMPLLFGEGAGKEKTHKLVASLQQRYMGKELITKATNKGGGVYNSKYFNKGIFAMDISSSAGTWSINFDQNSPVKYDKIGVAPLPRSDKNWSDGNVPLSPEAKGDSVISQGPSITLFKRAATDNKAAAWLFYKFATSDYMSAVWSSGGGTEKGGYVPVRTSSYSLPPLASVDDLTKEVLAISKTYGDTNRFYSSDVFVGSAGTRDAVGSLLSGLFLSNDNSSANIDDRIHRAYEDAAKGLAK